MRRKTQFPPRKEKTENVHRNENSLLSTRKPEYTTKFNARMLVTSLLRSVSSVARRRDGVRKGGRSERFERFEQFKRLMVKTEFKSKLNTYPSGGGGRTADEGKSGRHRRVEPPLSCVKASCSHQKRLERP